MSIRHRIHSLATATLLLLLQPIAFTAFAAAPTAPAAAPITALTTNAPPPPPVFQRTTLPEHHAFQKTLRQYLASLKPADFDHGVTQKFSNVSVPTDPETQYRNFLLTQMLQPLVGTKRGYPAVNAPSRLFTLTEIETPAGIKRPPVWAEPAAFLTPWTNQHNPYLHSRPMKLRAFVAMCIHLAMLDAQLEHAPEIGGIGRSDWFAPTLIVLAYPFPIVRDAVPENVRAAYLTGLRKMGQRLLDWGPKGEEPQLDVVGPLSLWYISQALGDPDFAKQTEAYARKLFTDPRRFHPAGYFVDRGGLDLGYGGQANFFTTWLALATGWTFVRDVVDRCHRLRAHVTLPEPDGRTFGPSHFQTRYSADAWRDQWEWGHYRDYAASLVTDEAAYLVPLPSAAVLTNAAAHRGGFFNAQIAENPVIVGQRRFARNDELINQLWSFRLWQSFNFPAMVSFAYEYYPVGAFAHRLKLEQEKSPLLRSPFLRDETFLRDFSQAFTVAKFTNYAAILHTGPVGAPNPDDGHLPLTGPYGFGGGQLSAFWTPATGSVLLGRRGGMTKDKNMDPLEDWRSWPSHAVSGIRPDGKIFTTARIQTPHVTSTLGTKNGTVRVTGTVPRGQLGQPKALDGRLDYSRTFTLAADALRVATTLQSTGQDAFAELYETLPVFLRDTAQQDKAQPTTIELERNKTWSAATTNWTDQVTAARLTRFTGAVLIEFDRPRRVKLSPAEFRDTYLSRASCRNLLIDLLENKDQPLVAHTASVSYRLRSVK